MALTTEQTNEVENVLKSTLRDKFQNYNPEPASMPFHTRLLGRDRLALYAFIHSLNTKFGTSFFEPVALALAKSNFQLAEKQIVAGDQISKEAQGEIQDIMDNLTTAAIDPDKVAELERIRVVCRKGEMVRIKPTKVDLLFVANSGEEFLFDIKTAKPNAGSFKELKRTMLEWAAVRLADNPKRQINTLVAIPYNPYEPKPYNRWTMRGMFDLDQELKVAEEFWDFIGGEGTYNDILGCFERVGVELRREIDAYFKRFDT